MIGKITIGEAVNMSKEERKAKISDYQLELEKLGMSHQEACIFTAAVGNLHIANTGKFKNLEN